MNFRRAQILKQHSRMAGCCFFILVWLAAASVYSQEEYVLKSAKAFKLIKVKVAKRVRIPKGYHEGLFFDGKNIWVNNGEKGKTWVVDTTSGSVLSEIEPIGTFTEGITQGPGGIYLATDWDTNRLYRAHVSAGRMIADSEVSFEPAHPTGVAWNGANIFVIIWTRGMGTKFHLIQLDEAGKPLRKMRIERIQEPAHMAWDGKYLWVTSWYSKLVYKVDIKSWEILGAFRSPVSDATGIAWDGKSLWLTGTRGDLYQLEVIDKQKVNTHGS